MKLLLFSRDQQNPNTPFVSQWLLPFLSHQTPKPFLTHLVRSMLLWAPCSLARPLRFFVVWNPSSTLPGCLFNSQLSFFSLQFFFVDYVVFYWLFCSKFLFLSWRNVVMLKSSKDTRYATDSVVTHDGIKFPCWALPNLLSFREKYGHDAYQKVFLLLFVSFEFGLRNSTTISSGLWMCYGENESCSYFNGNIWSGVF